MYRSAQQFFFDSRRFALVVGLLIFAQAARSADLSGVVVLGPAGRSMKSGGADESGAVISLHAVAPASTPLPPPGNFRILQKDKRFDPHVLAIPAGSSVSFPNLDPFFHNVFSMFDGKRFDLGLYEAGASRSTVFSKIGVCYLFCNIHVEMSAVVVVMDTPYFVVTRAGGQFIIHGIPPGRYRVDVWHERATPEGFPREITIGPDAAALLSIRLTDTGEMNLHHKNKYGKDYDPAPVSPGYH